MYWIKSFGSYCENSFQSTIEKEWNINAYSFIASRFPRKHGLIDSPQHQAYFVISRVHFWNIRDKPHFQRVFKKIEKKLGLTRIKVKKKKKESYPTPFCKDFEVFLLRKCSKMEMTWICICQSVPSMTLWRKCRMKSLLLVWLY